MATSSVKHNFVVNKKVYRKLVGELSKASSRTCDKSELKAKYERSRDISKQYPFR